MSSSGKYPQGLLPMLPPVSGVYVGTFAAGTTTGTPGNGNMYLVPVVTERPITLTALAVNVTSAGAAGSVVHMGIYSDNNGLPGNLLVDGGNANTTVTGLCSVSIQPFQLFPGIRVWFAGVGQGVPATNPTLTFNQTTGDSAPNNNGVVAGTGYYISGVTGSLPATPGVNPSTNPGGLIPTTMRILGLVQ